MDLFPTIHHSQSNETAVFINTLDDNTPLLKSDVEKWKPPLGFWWIEVGMFQYVKLDHKLLMAGSNIF